ncbi:MAG TPA: hypothetical protein VIM94_01780 [Salegentibacter sp.]|uniref:hypothetical protein n=1 Tax=Salegentibacter sp. TaxID=1903072 RepID=UPI002F933733
MATSFKKRFNDREGSTEVLQKETDAWLYEIFSTTEHIRFLTKFLQADIFEARQPNMFEMFESFKEKLDAYRKAIFILNREAHNHKNDLDGMKDCDDISCESFYREQHSELKENFTKFIAGFKDLQSQIFNYTGDLLITKE